MKKKIKEICSDCYGNNPFIQNEGFESYYNMLPKDNCGKCKDTPYPNPGQGNCCEEPDHSGIYTLGCIEGYGTKCDPLRIKENCLPSGNSDCDCECDCPSGDFALECTKEGFLPICDYTVVKQEVRTGTITVELPETILCSNNQNIIIDPNGGAMYESVLYVWVKNEGDPGHTPLDSSNTKYIYRTNLSPASGPYSINREDILDNLLVSKLSTLCDIEITATGFILSNPKKGNVLGVAFNYMSGPPVNYRNGILINADIPATQEGAYYDRVYCEIKTLSDLEVFLEDEWVNVETELNDNIWERLNSFEEIKDYRLVNNSIIQEHLGEVIQSNCRSTETAYPICDFVFNAESEEITVNFTEELIYDSLEEGVGLITITGQETFGTTIFGLQSIPTPSILTRTELINYIVDNFVGTSNFYIKSNTDTSITFLITYSINNFIFSLENLYLNNYNSIVFTGQNIAYEGNVTTDSYSVSFNYTQLYIEYTRLIDNEWINFGYSGETKIIIKKFTSESELTYRKYIANQNTAEETTTEQSFVKENCLPHPYIDITYSICEKLSDHEERIIELEENGGGEIEVSASNGTYNDEGTIKLGGNITEDTDIPNPDNKFFRVGNPGDAINLNANIPIEFGDFALTYTGFDYVSGTHQSFSGILKGVTFAPLDMEDTDIVGTFTIAGDPFNVTTPDGQIFIDGIWYDDGEVKMNKVVLNFTTSGISMNANIHSKTEQTSYYTGENGEIGRGLQGDNNTINDFIEGENGAINRIINNPTTGKAFIENITDTKQEITVDNIELNTTEYSLTSEGSKTGYTDSIIKIIGKNIADGIGIFLGNIWRNVFVKTGLVIFGGGADYINGFDIIGEGSSVGGGVSGESLGSGTGLYLNGKTNNSGVQYPAIRMKGNNIGTFDDIIVEPVNGKLSVLNVPTRTQTFVYGEDVNGKFVKNTIPGGGSSFTCTDVAACTVITDLQTALTNLQNSLPKTLVEFRGSASYTGTTSESLLYASAAIPSTAWRENGNYILTILGVCQAAQTQNAVIKIYLNTANTLNGSEILINQSHVLTDNTYTPNGGNVLAIHLPIFKNTIELLTNKGNSTIANINTGSIFSSNINMTYAKIRTKVTPDFTGNLYLIITTTQSAVSVTTEINNIIFKEI
jgi:hypothetical protein